MHFWRNFEDICFISFLLRPFAIILAFFSYFFSRFYYYLSSSLCHLSLCLSMPANFFGGIFPLHTLQKFPAFFPPVSQCFIAILTTSQQFPPKRNQFDLSRCNASCLFSLKPTRFATSIFLLFVPIHSHFAPVFSIPPFIRSVFFRSIESFLSKLFPFFIYIFSRKCSCIYYFV